ncbi:MAG TPA: 4-alpha-glucanotransferase [Polyangia bacterium]|nr:4-alpha-glucanotransferase [Polyangia bacterium]
MAADLTVPIREGLAVLGIARLVLAIHDQSFPSSPNEDIGRGSPYGLGARRLLRLAQSLGFDGLQLGPQGATSLDNPSPYDGALFTRSPLSIALGTLQDDPDWSALAKGLLAPAVDGRPAGLSDRTNYTYAWHVSHRALQDLYKRFGHQPARSSPLHARFAAFRRDNEAVLTPDGEFEALSAAHGTDDWRLWPGLTSGSLDQLLWCPPRGQAAAAERRRAELHASHAPDIDRHLFGQFVLDEQHRALRAEAQGLALYGDFQIGFSHRDVWSRRNLFWAEYLLGAPPSRTNPEGQPWGYPVLDPSQIRGTDSPGSAGPVLTFVAARVKRMLADFDGVRIDHPHGLVCPWVYKAADPDPIAAVQRGARLTCSPNLPDHPKLAPLAIPTVDQLSKDPGIARYADDWVRQLDPDQVDRYGVMFDAIMSRVVSAGRQPSDVVCEVLSTWPAPLRAVMSRYGLGRFCITQKSDMARADDVYRSENASERDWIMVGNHDTRPVWMLTDAWHATAAGRERAGYLTDRLMPVTALRPRFRRWLEADGRHLAQGLFADLFAGPARRVSVFFADLFGMRAVYNRPGIVDSANWTLRLPPDFEDLYRDRLRRADAVNLPLALALAIIARRRTEPAAFGAAALGPLLQAAGRLGPGDNEIVAIIESAMEAGRA